MRRGRIGPQQPGRPAAFICHLLTNNPWEARPAAMSTRPDKAKVIDEIWDEDRVAGFLEARPPENGPDPDFFVLWKAYQGMRIGDFRRFLAMFTAAGRNIDAVNERGETLSTFIAPHRHAAEFIEALVAHGAQPTAGAARARAVAGPEA